ncbi:MAG: High-affinity branched-chain amino acid transport ATP-binding protein LivF [Firmicutes bacterium ADurb.Bin373]|nr:MAG: High-affinity branched-chain amino acid transport ATP-binding protein LivF [Firmicutes bacterium ADurb.Bin373]
MLEIKCLEVCHGWVQALRGLSFRVVRGEMLAVLGLNGAGKSTLLGALAGLYKIKKGDILLDGESLSGKPPHQIVKLGISLVPERREIFNSLTVIDNLLLGAYHRYRYKKNEVIIDVVKIMDLFPALRGKENHPAGTLSGGLQQMLAIGRGLMARPRLLLLDEPSVGLAPLVTREIMTTLAELKKTGVTIILVEQNTAAALKVADRALVMERGGIVMSGKPRDMMENSRVQQACLGRTRAVQPAAAL